MPGSRTGSATGRSTGLMAGLLALCGTAGAAVLAETWRAEFGARKATLVFSAVAAKDIAGILERLVPLAERIHLCPVDTPRAATPGELAACLPAAAPPAVPHDSFDAAFDAALAGDGPVLVAGSLFLVGEARAQVRGDARHVLAADHLDAHVLERVIDLARLAPCRHARGGVPPWGR